MKYIKLFEDINYYFQINGNIPYSEVSDEEVNFDPKDLSLINKFISKWNISLKEVPDSTSRKYIKPNKLYKRVYVEYNGGENYQLDIYITCNIDEWYYVLLREYKFPDGWIIVDDKYKCDQLNGLLKFLNDKMSELKPRRKKII